MDEIGNFGLVILIAGVFCLSAILISFLFTKLKEDENKAGKYECGFANFDRITLVDERLHIVPPFMVLEMMVLWLLFYLMSSVFMHISIQSACFHFFLMVFVMCSLYVEKNIFSQNTTYFNK